MIGKTLSLSQQILEAHSLLHFNSIKKISTKNIGKTLSLSQHNLKKCLHFHNKYWKNALTFNFNSNRKTHLQNKESTLTLSKN